MTQYDMRDFMVNGTPTQGLTGTHYMRTFREGSDIYEVKSPTGGPFEHYQVTETGIYIRQETGGYFTPQCTWDNNWDPNKFRFWPDQAAANPYQWCPRVVRDGQVYWTGDTVEYGVWTDTAGAHRKSIVQPSYPCWVTVVRNMPLGGNIGVRPLVVVLGHGWKTGRVDWEHCELYFYDQWLGFILFRDVNAGVVTSQAVFDWEILADAPPVGPAIPALDGFTPCGA